jgi:LmbE family N-acetylglucosaminyl deacetylase
MVFGRRVVWHGAGEMPALHESGVLELPAEGKVAAISRESIEGANWVPLWKHKRVLAFGRPKDVLSIRPFMEGLEENGNSVGLVSRPEKFSSEDMREARPDVLFLPTTDDHSEWANAIRRRVLGMAGGGPKFVAYYDTDWLTRWPVAYPYTKEERAYKQKLMGFYGSQNSRTDFAQATLDVNRALALEMGLGGKYAGVEMFGVVELGGDYLDDSKGGSSRQCIFGSGAKGRNSRNVPFPKNHLLIVAGVHYDDESLPIGAFARRWKEYGPVVNLMFVSGARAVIDDIEALKVDDVVKHWMRDGRRFDELTAASAFSGIETISLCHELTQVAPDGMNFYDRFKVTGKPQLSQEEFDVIDRTMLRIIKSHPGVGGVWVAMPYMLDAHPDHQVVHHAVSDVTAHTGGLAPEIWGLQYPSPWAGTGNMFYFFTGENQLEARRRWARKHWISRDAIEARELREHAYAIVAGEMIGLRGFGQKPVHAGEYAVRMSVETLEDARQGRDGVIVSGRPRLSTAGRERVYGTLFTAD